MCGWSGNAPGSIINYALLRRVVSPLLEEKLRALLGIKMPAFKRALVGIYIRRMFPKRTDGDWGRVCVGVTKYTIVKLTPRPRRSKRAHQPARRRGQGLLADCVFCERGEEVK